MRGLAIIYRKIIGFVTNFASKTLNLGDNRYT